MELALHAHESTVDRVLQQALDTGNGKLLATFCAKSEFREFISQKFEAVASGCIQLKRLAHDGSIDGMWLDVARLVVVLVAQRSEP